MKKKRRDRKENDEFLLIKKIFYISLDMIILLSFLMALYFTYSQDYTKTILFLILGSLLLIFFTLRAALKKKPN